MNDEMNTTQLDGTNAHGVKCRATVGAGRRRGRMMLAGVVAATTMFVGAASASATQTSTTGLAGPSAVSPGTCKYVRTNVSGSLQTVTAPPSVWARNSVTGWGNDAQRVRYMAFAVEVGTGRVLTNTGWSGTVRAWDNKPAQWTGSTMLNVDWRVNFQVNYLIHWLNSSGVVVGSALQVVDSYRYYDGFNVGPYGPFASCAKYR